MKRILTALTLVLALASAAQAVQRIDVDTKAIAAKAGSAERKALVERFNAGDRSLTPAQMAEVYYGQAFTPGYKATDSYPDVDAAYSSGNYAQTLALVDAVLRDNPVALNQLFRGYVSASKSAEPRLQERAQSFQSRILNLCDLIFASGTGVSADSPFLILTDEDALAFVRNYLQPQEIIGTSGMGDLFAVKVKWAGEEEPVIFYFARP